MNKRIAFVCVLMVAATSVEACASRLRSCTLSGRQCDSERRIVPYRPHTSRWTRDVEPTKIESAEVASRIFNLSSDFSVTASKLHPEIRKLERILLLIHKCGGEQGTIDQVVLHDNAEQIELQVPEIAKQFGKLQVRFHCKGYNLTDRKQGRHGKHYHDHDDDAEGYPEAY